jgi:Ran GTPase-activating protein (RanGAP) involved in mRNA processing and transport
MLAVKRALESKEREAQLFSKIMFDDEAVTVLAAGLASNAIFVYLVLAGNAFGIKGVQALSEALKSNAALRWLELSSSDLGDAELRALLPGLQANRGIRRLQLSYNKFSERPGASC